MAATKIRNAVLISISIILLLLMIYILEVGQRAYSSGLENEKKQSIEENLALVRAELVAELNSEIYHAGTITTIITLNPEAGGEGWEEASQLLLEGTKHVRFIALAPDNIIRYIYPLQGNEAVVNVDYRDVPDQWELIKKAKQTKSFQIAGPLELIQGGTAIIIRIPVFLDPPQYENYWGVASIVLNINSLLSSSSLEQLSNEYEIAIRRVRAGGNIEPSFYGNDSTFSQALATETIRFPSGQWLMAAKLKPGASSGDNRVVQYWIRIVGVCLLLVIGLAITFIYYLYSCAKEISLRDELTQLPNRRHFMAELEQAIIIGQQRGSSFAVLYIDLDGFKSTNDTLGHAAGDALLKEVGKRLFEGVRTTDVVARVGGDEFLILISRVTEEETINNIAASLLYILCTDPFTYKGNEVKINASIGYARFPQDARGIDELLHHADQSMYRMKNARKQRTNIISQS